MYVERVVLRNIKGFEQLDLNFAPSGSNHAGWAVITGDNSAGKTALIRSIAFALLGPDQTRGLVPDFAGWVTRDRAKGSISVEVLPNHEFDKTAKGGYPSKSTFWSEVEFAQSGDAWQMNSVDLLRKKRKSAVNGPWQPGTPGWFSVGYGPFRRMYGSSPDAQRFMVIAGRIPNFVTLFKEDATLAEGEQWVKDLNYRKLEERAHETVTFDNLVRLVEDDFLRQGVSLQKINSDGINLKDAAGRPMLFADMSDGYRSSLAMLIDIYRHMVECYGPNIVEKADDGSYVVARPGVVLIDEVDAHLHPKWQREIGFWLQKHFPLVQFIVSTHSPIVCQAANHGRIYHLPDLADRQPPFQLDEEDYRRIIAGKTDVILLSPAFDMDQTRSPVAVRARRRHAQLRSRQLSLNGLSEAELTEYKQLSLFANDEDLQADAASTAY